MVISRKNPIILFLICFLFIGFIYPQPVEFIYERPFTADLTLRESESSQEADYTFQLNIYQQADADPDADYYLVEYHIEDLKYGANSTIYPCYIEIEIVAANLLANESSIVIMRSQTQPDGSSFRNGGGSINFQTEEQDSGTVWAGWNISGAGGWPLLVPVADSDFTVSLGFRVGEMHGISVNASCSITWASFDRLLGPIQYVDQISIPIAKVAYSA